MLAKLLISACLFWLMSWRPVAAQDCDQQYQCSADSDNYSTCLNQQKSCWEGKIAAAKSESNTLQSAIAIIDGQVRVQALQIQQTQNEINTLEKEVGQLSERIEGLAISLNRLSGILLQHIKENYKHSRLPYKQNFFASESFNGFISQLRYRDLAQNQTLDLMKRTELQRLTYNEQKELKEHKQAEVEKKRQELQSQKNLLDSQKASKNELLKQTQNSEAVYQQKLSAAIAELNSLRAFSLSKGASVVGEQNSPDGWYFSQRDQRWAGQRLGSSSMSMLDVGCLVASTTMLKKKMGENVNPITIASNSSYFFANTAYMLRPWPAPLGYYYQHSAYTQNTLDNRLAEGPVIVKILAGPYGTHFLVIKEKQGDNYIMHDPWEGYDKKFTDYYSLSQIREVASLVRR